MKWPNGLTVDTVAERLYWVDAQLDYISSTDLDGARIKRVLSSRIEVRLGWQVIYTPTISRYAFHKENVIIKYRNMHQYALFAGFRIRNLFMWIQILIQGLKYLRIWI